MWAAKNLNTTDLFLADPRTTQTEENKKKKVEDIGTFCGRAEEENWSPATCHNKLTERYAGLSPTTRIKERVNDIVYTRSVGSRLQDSEKRIVKA